MSVLRSVMLAAALATAAVPVAADTAAPPVAQPLGGDRYQLGQIVVDKAAGTFTVPGTIVDLGKIDAPLEFIAGTRGGVKLYETLIELDTNAVEFNVACILVGLDATKGRRARHHFDEQPVAGMAVDIHVEWRENGVPVRRSAAELIRVEDGKGVKDDWVYTGSFTTRDGRFQAEEDGVLVGFVHAPESLIEHRTGIGLGNYGDTRFDPDKVPPSGTAVTLTISVR